MSIIAYVIHVSIYIKQSYRCQWAFWDLIWPNSSPAGLWHWFKCTNSSVHLTRWTLSSAPSDLLQTKQLKCNRLAAEPFAPLCPQILQQLLPYSFTHAKKKHTQAFLIWTERKTGKPKVAKRVQHLVPKAWNSKCPNQICCVRGSQKLCTSDRCSQGWVWGLAFSRAFRGRLNTIKSNQTKFNESKSMHWMSVGVYSSTSGY